MIFALSHRYNVNEPEVTYWSYQTNFMLIRHVPKMHGSKHNIPLVFKKIPREKSNYLKNSFLGKC